MGARDLINTYEELLVRTNSSPSSLNESNSPSSSVHNSSHSGSGNTFVLGVAPSHTMEPQMRVMARSPSAMRANLENGSSWGGVNGSSKDGGKEYSPVPLSTDLSPHKHHHLHSGGSPHHHPHSRPAVHHYQQQGLNVTFDVSSGCSGCACARLIAADHQHNPGNHPSLRPTTCLSNTNPSHHTTPHST